MSLFIYFLVLLLSFVYAIGKVNKLADPMNKEYYIMTLSLYSLVAFYMGTAHYFNKNVIFGYIGALGIPLTVILSIYALIKITQLVYKMGNK